MAATSVQPASPLVAPAPSGWLGLTLAPIRVCCGRRHDGFVCGDGRAMCARCFDLFDVAVLALDGQGQPTNLCRPCAALHRVEYY